MNPNTAIALQSLPGKVSQFFLCPSAPVRKIHSHSGTCLRHQEVSTKTIHTLVLMVVDKEVNELEYERVADGFVYRERLTELDGPTAGGWT